MYWSELKALIRRHTFHPALVLFPKHDSSHLPGDIQSILDLNLPRRRGLVHTGYTYDDMMRDSFVCNAAWFNGEIPKFGREAVKVGQDRPVRGWHQTLQILLSQGTIYPSRELDKLLGEDSRGHAEPDMRLFYE